MRWFCVADGPGGPGLTTSFKSLLVPDAIWWFLCPLVKYQGAWFWVLGLAGLSGQLQGFQKSQCYLVPISSLIARKLGGEMGAWACSLHIPVSWDRVAYSLCPFIPHVGPLENENFACPAPFEKWDWHRWRHLPIFNYVISYLNLNYPGAWLWMDFSVITFSLSWKKSKYCPEGKELRYNYCISLICVSNDN